MKNLLLLLLLANILYFVWGWFVEDEPTAGELILEESALGPPLPGTRSGGRDGWSGYFTRQWAAIRTCRQRRALLRQCWTLSEQR